MQRRRTGYNGLVMNGPTVVLNPTRPRQLPPIQCSMEPQIFHRRLAEYETTPLCRLTGIAGRLGVGELLVKDESERLGLPSFKILGASWAIYTLLSRKLGLALGSWEGLEELYALLEPLRPLELVTASDGNHGRAVASMAQRLGLWARVFVPQNTAPARIEAIQSHNAEVVVVDGTYDDAVQEAAAVERNGDGILVQDTGWDGYMEVPSWIVDGYDTLFQEADEQLMELGIGRPDLVVLQVGVGSLAAAGVRHYASLGISSMPRLLGVEAAGAATAVLSLQRGEPSLVPGPHSSTMAGLNCGLVSAQAWPWIQGGLDGVVVIDDPRALQAVSELRSAGIVSGESGAAGLGALLEICSNPAMPFVRERGRMNTASVVLVINTEGDTGQTGR
jgi:diaminopropionate ammonia-lyase